MIFTKTSLLLGAAFALAACGGKSAPSTDTPQPDPTPKTSTELTPGTSGFPGLDWGDDAAKVQATHPGAETVGEELVAPVTHGGQDATAKFTFMGGGLIAISVAYRGEYPDMGACTDPFHAVEAELIKSLGESAEENLAAYWTTASAEVTLACNPDENGEKAELGASFIVLAKEQ